MQHSLGNFHLRSTFLQLFSAVLAGAPKLLVSSVVRLHQSPLVYDGQALRLAQGQTKWTALLVRRQALVILLQSIRRGSFVLSPSQHLVSASPKHGPLSIQKNNQRYQRLQERHQKSFPCHRCTLVISRCLNVQRLVIHASSLRRPTKPPPAFGRKIVEIRRNQIPPLTKNGQYREYSRSPAQVNW